MRVLMVTNTYPPAEITGVGALVFELAHQLSHDGHEARVLTRNAPANDVYATGVGGRKLLFPLAAGREFLRLSKQQPFDLVHVHESDGVLVCLALRLARWLQSPAGQARLVATLQVSYRRERLAVKPIRTGDKPNGKIISRPTTGERIFAWLRAPLLSLLGRVTARLSDAVVAPSRVTARELEEDYGAKIVAVIPNGVPKETATPVGNTTVPPEISNEKQSHPLILYAGRLRTRKAVGVLIEAFAALHERLPSASLVLAGDGEHRTALEERVTELGLQSAVQFLGAVPRPEMNHWYQAADIFCLPSIYEGFPVAILEAMAAGLPVVSTTVSGIPEAVEEGETGLLVPPENTAALTTALERLSRDDALRHHMSRQAQQRVRELFDIEKISRDYLKVWQQLL